ncbi:hypothetical protein P692DRAFT_20869005 [Suillus brevipes Sb2]|nr:hypothetical protein P692DRAFT_20869005 [Suillus brevipes Sb2]
METDESSSSIEDSTPVNVCNTGFNLGMSLPMAQPPPLPRLNLGMDIDIPAAPSVPPHKPYNLGINLTIPGTAPPLSLAAQTQQPFNLGFPLPAPQPAAMPFNLGFTVAPPPTAPPSNTPTPMPFNLGFMVAPPPTVLPSHTPPSSTLPPTTSKPFNLGFGLPPAVTPAATGSTVGYGINNIPFQFECDPPSTIDEWQPELIWAPQQPPVASSSSAASSPPAMADAAPGPSVPLALPQTDGHLECPTLKSLIGDAERAAIDIVHRLGGQEIDHLAQMMVGGALGPGDDVRDPKPDERPVNQGLQGSYQPASPCTGT